MSNFNYEWKPVEEKGAYEHGFIEVFQATIGSSRALVTINYLVQMNDEVERKALATVYLEGEKSQWTKTRISSIADDIEARIENMKDLRYRATNKLDYMTFQVFNVDTIDGIKLWAMADRSFNDNE
jgi:hypothetical protein